MVHALAPVFFTAVVTVRVVVPLGDCVPGTVSRFCGWHTAGFAGGLGCVVDDTTGGAVVVGAGALVVGVLVAGRLLVVGVVVAADSAVQAVSTMAAKGSSAKARREFRIGSPRLRGMVCR
jgi:hypothetical protein